MEKAGRNSENFSRCYTVKEKDLAITTAAAEMHVKAQTTPQKQSLAAEHAVAVAAKGAPGLVFQAKEDVQAANIILALSHADVAVNVARQHVGADGSTLAALEVAMEASEENVVTGTETVVTARDGMAGAQMKAIAAQVAGAGADVLAPLQAAVVAAKQLTMDKSKFSETKVAAVAAKEKEHERVLDKLDQRKIITLIHVDVHNRDVENNLITSEQAHVVVEQLKDVVKLCSQFKSTYVTLSCVASS